MAATLSQVAAIGPYFTIETSDGAVPDPGGPPWRPVRTLYEVDDGSAPGVLTELIDAVQDRIGHREPRVAVSLLFQGYAARLFSPALAAMATAGLLPDLDPYRLHWRYVDGRPIQLLLPDPAGRRTADAGRLHAAVAGDHLAPLIAALRRTVPISERLLWGNAASALAGACRMMGPELSPKALRIAQDLLRRGRLRGTGTLAAGPPPGFTRNSCCLYYRVPGGGTCGDCVLNRRAAPGT